MNDQLALQILNVLEILLQKLCYLLQMRAAHSSKLEQYKHFKVEKKKLVLFCVTKKKKISTFFHCLVGQILHPDVV